MRRILSFSPLFLPLSLYHRDEDKLVKDRLPGGGSPGGFPSGLSDLVSSVAISNEGERNKERKTTDPFSSLCLPLEGTERLCLSALCTTWVWRVAVKSRLEPNYILEDPPNSADGAAAGWNVKQL